MIGTEEITQIRTQDSQIISSQPPPYPLCLPPEYKIEENLQIPEPVPPQEVGFEEYTEIFVQMEEIVTELVTKSLEEINLQSTLIE